jgi:hypothetical protein
MSSPFPDEIESNMDAAETGRKGCLIPKLDDEPDTSSDTEWEDYNEATD